jgi:AraC-like DNA-binding protein
MARERGLAVGRGHRAAPTVSVRFVRLLTLALEARGVDVAAFLATLRVDRATLDDPDARLSMRVDDALWAEAPRLTGDDAIGLHLGEHLPPSAFDIISYTMRSSPTLGGAFERLARYIRLLHDVAELGLHVDRPSARLTFRLAPEGTPRQQAEFTLAVFVQFCRQATKTDLVPQAVEFSHPAPADVSEHERIFRAPLSFGRPTSALLLPPEALDLPLAQADAALLSLLERQIQERVARLPQGESVVDRARRLLAGELSGGLPNVETVARQMRMSPRTLHRRLREGGTSFRALLDGLRHDLAARYLAEEQMPIAEAAFLLGFSEASAFHRSFKRWTGQTPAEYRRGEVTRRARRRELSALS